MIKLLFFQFRVTNSNLEKYKLHFQLLTRSWMILKAYFYSCSVPLEGNQEILLLVKISGYEILKHL